MGVEEASASGLKKKKRRVISPLCIFIWNSEFEGGVIKPLILDKKKLMSF